MTNQQPMQARTGIDQYHIYTALPNWVNFVISDVAVLTDPVYTAF